jgi:hypothetical protein
MNKKLLVVIGLTVVALSLVTAGVVFAQGGRPGGGGMMGNGYGQTYTGTMPYNGMMNRFGYTGTMPYADMDGPMHDEMLDAFAKAVSLSRTDLDAHLAKGETMYQIAIAQGIKAENFPTLMTDVRKAAIEQAVTNGSLTRQQADWMLTHQMGGGRGAGRGGMMGGGNFGSGRGYNGNCPMHNPAPTPAPNS